MSIQVRADLDNGPVQITTTESIEDEAESRMEGAARSAQDIETFSQLAKLPAAEYDRRREAEAEKLGIRVATLDREVKKYRLDEDSDAAGKPVLFEQIEPWPEPVDGSALVDVLITYFSLYLMLPKHGELVLSLWAMHAHALEAFYHSPRINARSAEKGSGKTTLLDLLANVCPRALRLDNATTAITFRLVDQYQPTLLIDEHDSFLRGNEELRGALNSGHRRGGIFPRCVGDDNEVKLFRVFAATALAGIGKLPDTLADRSIVIEMKRAKPGELRARYDSRKINNTLQRKTARWADDNLDKLKIHDPEVSAQLYNRVADNWRPLFSVADVIGGEWPGTIREAALNFHQNADQDSRRVMLLQDIHDLFVAKKTEKLSSATIVESLGEMDERPWPEFGRTGKPISKKQLASLLEPWCKPKQVWIDSKNERGYETGQLEDAFRRYLPDTPFQSARTLDASDGAASSQNRSARTENALADENALKAKRDTGSSTLAVTNPHVDDGAYARQENEMGVYNDEELEI